MVPIKEALTFDDVTMAPKYSEVLPADVDTSIKLTEKLKLKIHIISGGRADYDLLKNLIFSLNKTKKFFNTKFIVTGSHLSKKHGNTVNQILNDKIKIFKKIDIKINSDTPNDISKNISYGFQTIF